MAVEVFHPNVSSPKVKNTVGPAQQNSNQSIILLKILKRKKNENVLKGAIEH